MTISEDYLRFIMPRISEERVSSFINPIAGAMDEFSINTGRRRAAFIAQVAHETEELHYLREIANGSAYEHRTDLGNIYDGDGIKYVGRGALMATGREMYMQLSVALKLPLIDQPELLEKPFIAFISAAYIWKLKGLNLLADNDRFFEITHRINGGYNGGDSRLEYWLRARKMENL